MIWVGGRIVADDALTISASDRTFEHGLGLFETLRTWNGHATLLERHRARMSRSAQELGIPFENADFPDARAVRDLVEASGLAGDAMLRITLTGGLSSEHGSVLWMRAAPLPPEVGSQGANVSVGSWFVAPYGEPLAQHKSLNYWSRRLAYDAARRAGYDETLSGTTTSMHPLTVEKVWEGSRTNLFAVRGDALVTPALYEPIVPGIMRRVVLEQAVNLPLRVVDEKPVTVDAVKQAEEVFLTNSVRGIIPVARLGAVKYKAPGPFTQNLMILVSDWLKSGGQGG